MELMVSARSATSPLASTVILSDRSDRASVVGGWGVDLGDRAHLVGEVGGHDVDRVGQALPPAGHAGYVGLATEAAFGAHLPGYPGDLVGECPEGVGHGVDGLGQDGYLALGLDGDPLRQV